MRCECWKLKQNKKNKRRTTKAAFSRPTAQSHITEEAELDLHLGVHTQRTGELDAPAKHGTQMSVLIIPRCMNLLNM